ncbi:MAG: HEAT repeat domain-containing protein [Chloroflexota bacterium]|nr:HEAT repeat domain-containing protein [Chloroflexota bacterium]
MANISWPKALVEACLHAHHPGLYTLDQHEIVWGFLWDWGDYLSDVLPYLEEVVYQERDNDGRFTQDIFSILQRALIEGNQEVRVFALFLLGGLATPEARDLLISFLASAHRQERWASAIALGRLKEERVFAVLQTLLLEGFAASEIFTSVEEWHAAQEDGHLYRKTLEEQRRAQHSDTLWRVFERLESIDYEWYLRQRSECALVLGAWDNPAAVPFLREALQAAWGMEQDWPNYEGPDESGPGIWHFFQDHLVFALGQLGAWDALVSLHLPEAHLLIARVYLILGSLQVPNPRIFDGDPLLLPTLFRIFPQDGWLRAWKEADGWGDTPFVDPAQVKALLAQHFGLSPTEQEDALTRFSTVGPWYERTKEGSRHLYPLESSQRIHGGDFGDEIDVLFPFL